MLAEWACCLACKGLILTSGSYELHASTLHSHLVKVTSDLVPNYGSQRPSSCSLLPIPAQRPTSSHPPALQSVSLWPPAPCVVALSACCRRRLGRYRRPAQAVIRSAQARFSDWTRATRTMRCVPASSPHRAFLHGELWHVHRPHKTKARIFTRPFHDHPTPTPVLRSNLVQNVPYDDYARRRRYQRVTHSPTMERE